MLTAWGPAGVRALGRAPLTALPVEHLAPYAFKALLTMGDEEDLKYFLPRMLELYATDLHWDTETLFARVGEAAWKSWGPVKQQAIESFLVAVWRSC